MPRELDQPRPGHDTPAQGPAGQDAADREAEAPRQDVAEPQVPRQQSREHGPRTSRPWTRWRRRSPRRPRTPRRPGAGPTGPAGEPALAVLHRHVRGGRRRGHLRPVRARDQGPVGADPDRPGAVHRRRAGPGRHLADAAPAAALGRGADDPARRGRGAGGVPGRRHPAPGRPGLGAGWSPAALHAHPAGSQLSAGPAERPLSHRSSGCPGCCPPRAAR